MPRRRAKTTLQLPNDRQIYRLRLEQMSDGQLRRERIKLGVKPADAWELAVWREVQSTRQTPAWA